jgi:hypothetical protein
MKKIFLLLAFALTASVANAWMKTCDEGIAIMASKNLSPEAKSVVTKYLGTSLKDDVHYLNILESKKKSPYTKEVHFVHLDSALKPLAASENDALVALEKAVSVVEKRDSHSAGEVKAALRIIINLMCDIHNFSYYRIEGVAHSQKPFSFKRTIYEYSKRKSELGNVKWMTMWTGYGNRHRGFSGDLWAEDMQLCMGHKKAEFSQGTLRDWVNENAAKSASFLSFVNPSYVMPALMFNELEDTNYEQMVRASFRLAALLNEVIR